MYKIFIDGSAGTTGLRIYERLGERSDIELLKISEEDRKNLDIRKQAVCEADAAFLCLPDAAAAEIVCALKGEKVKILDTSTAHRTNPEWAYGFPELSKAHKKAVITSAKTAVPGCHASGFIALVYPLVACGLMPKDYPASCFSLTGYSGGGKKMIAEYEAKERVGELLSPRQYGLLQKHKHLPEMKKITGLDAEPFFSPVVGDFYSGMTVTVPLFPKLLNKKVSAKDVQKIFAEHYADGTAVRVAPFGFDGFLGTNNLSGKDFMEIIISGNDDRILIASRFDNLGKGSSGAAVQCMNLMLGADEGAGLAL